MPGKVYVSNDRALWLSRNILPHESALRAQLSRWRVPHDLDVDDIIQETYAKLATLQDVESIRYPKAYFFQAARSIILMHVRRSRVVSIQAVEQLDQLGIASDEPGPEVQTSDRQQLRLLAGMIARLPGASRAAMTMRLAHGLSHHEIGAKLGMTANAVQKSLARSLASFVRQLGRDGMDDPETARDMKPASERQHQASVKDMRAD